MSSTLLSSRVLVNGDMGEAVGPEEDLMPLLDQANIACGFHAGDACIMLETVRLAKKHNKLVGAHPGLPDKEGFGRRLMDIPPHDLYCQVLYQVGALQAILQSEGMKMSHIKPHGKLYRMIKDDPAVGESVMKAVKVFNVPFIGLPGTAHETLAKRHGVEFIPEFFPDLYYDANGQTIPLVSSGRVPLSEIQGKTEKIIREDRVLSVDGVLAKPGFEGRQFTCCVHSDLPGALDCARAVRAAVSNTS